MRNWILRKAPTLRNNKGALQVRVRLDGKDHFINRMGRFDDPAVRARALGISAEIWCDVQHAELDQRLNRYRPLIEPPANSLLKQYNLLLNKSSMQQ